MQKSFGSLEVLKGIDLEVKEGEVVCLIGPFWFRQIYISALPESVWKKRLQVLLLLTDNDITDPKCRYQ